MLVGKSLANLDKRRSDEKRRSDDCEQILATARCSLKSY